MTKFDGFPAGAHYTAIPSLFFARLLPEIEDLAELKVTLHVFFLLQRRRSKPAVVTQAELQADRTLVAGLQSLGGTEAVRRGLDLAVARGTLLGFTCGEGERAQPAYLINGARGQETLARLQSGELTLALGKVAPLEPAPTKRANIFVLYEENIGVLSPLLVEQLTEAEAAYPEEWIRAAFREAVSLNKRNWRYIARILERWALEGKQDGEPGPRSQVNEDPGKYVRGRYGRFVRH